MAASPDQPVNLVLPSPATFGADAGGEMVSNAATEQPVLQEPLRQSKVRWWKPIVAVALLAGIAVGVVLSFKSQNGLRATTAKSRADRPSNEYIVDLGADVLSRLNKTVSTSQWSRYNRTTNTKRAQVPRSKQAEQELRFLCPQEYQVMMAIPQACLEMPEFNHDGAIHTSGWQPNCPVSRRADEDESQCDCSEPTRQTAVGCAPPPSRLIEILSLIQFADADGVYLKRSSRYSWMSSVYFFEDRGDGLSFHIKSAETNRYLQPAGGYAAENIPLVFNSFGPSLTMAFEVLPVGQLRDGTGGEGYMGFLLQDVETGLFVKNDPEHSDRFIYGTQSQLGAVVFYLGVTQQDIDPDYRRDPNAVGIKMANAPIPRTGLGLSYSYPECADGFPLIPVEASDCPWWKNRANCEWVGAGRLCEGDGECGTDQYMDQCNPGSWDIYRKAAGQLLEDGTQLVLVPVEANVCPEDGFRDIEDCTQVPFGALCEGDGELGTDNSLDNCGAFDIYRKVVMRA